MKKNVILTFVALAFGMGAWAQNIANPADNASLDGGFVRV